MRVDSSMRSTSICNFDYKRSSFEEIRLITQLSTEFSGYFDEFLDTAIDNKQPTEVNTRSINRNAKECDHIT